MINLPPQIPMVCTNNSAHVRVCTNRTPEDIKRIYEQYAIKGKKGNLINIEAQKTYYLSNHAPIPKLNNSYLFAHLR